MTAVSQIKTFLISSRGTAVKGNDPWCCAHVLENSAYSAETIGSGELLLEGIRQVTRKHPFTHIFCFV